MWAASLLHSVACEEADCQEGNILLILFTLVQSSVAIPIRNE